MNRTDIHFHALPGVDDGPATLDESVELAAIAAAQGTRTIVVTPHVRRDFLTDVSDLPDRVRELQEELVREGVHLDLRCGAELGHEMVSRLRQSELETIAQGPPGARWVLVETPFGGLGPAFTAAADELRDRGFGVVVAHPERAAGALDAGYSVLLHELARGSVLQVNALSLDGRHGGESRAAGRRLVAEGLASVIASDAHGGWRMPALELGVEQALEAGLGLGHAQRLVDGNPRRLLERGLVAWAFAAA
ncbi:MAG: protein-tyrosine phosphatase [Thermoleophilaceae bacterium]|nr:protein-tyrosine phosphatase [Thermoleophilaceae bacterium]